MKKIKEDLCHKFWREYLESYDDYDKKEKHITFMVKAFNDCLKVKNIRHRNLYLRILIRNYFDDLIDFCGGSEVCLEREKALSKRLKK